MLGLCPVCFRTDAHTRAVPVCPRRGPSRHAADHKRRATQGPSSRRPDLQDLHPISPSSPSTPFSTPSEKFDDAYNLGILADAVHTLGPILGN